YQFHFCTKNTLKFIHYLPKRSKTICSFWGSDLYRINDPYNLFYVKKALRKTTKITIQTPEMVTDLGRKYGAFLLDKVVFAQFALETKIYNYIDLFEKDIGALMEFKNTHQIPVDNVVL